MTSRTRLANMLTMQRFLASLGIGVDVTSTAVRFGVIGRQGNGPAVHAARTINLPTGVLTESFGTSAIAGRDELSAALRSGLEESSSWKTSRIGLSLPDAMFRIQILEFDELPRSAPDREKLIRWRLEKGAAFDMSDTMLRFQVHARPERGNVVLAAVAKQELIVSFEELLSGLGFEVWNIIPASFSVLNFYASYLHARSSTYAFARLSGGSYSTIIVDSGVPRFYRYREIKAAVRDEVVGRLVRELDDSLHFYMHRDRHQPSEVGHLFVAGEPGVIDSLSDALKSGTSMEIERLLPRSVVPSLEDEQGMLVAAFGAGGMQ